MRKIGAIDPKKTRQYLLILLVVFMWSFAILSSTIKSSIDKISIKTVPPFQYDEKLEADIKGMVSGHPIEGMSKYIASRDKQTAAFMVAIAKKESNWGERVPVLDGKDCFNYWGYRGKREHMGSGGHTCFNSPRDAVYTVANRIDELVIEYNLDTPSKMVVWKCGYGCAGHDKKSINKWVADVDLYYQELVN
ncbi:MAG TPA: hypothetical protein ENH35_01880 [Candidatus Moranbacteria bacterium]|nr:hypothetical protein [Candidatus Moranbacteria bacterium]